MLLESPHRGDSNEYTQNTIFSIKKENHSNFFPNLQPWYIFWGWSGGAMVLGKLPVPGRPTIWMTVGQGPIVLAVGAGGGCLNIFTLFYPFSPLSPSLWETARYRLKYCLKGPLNPKNQPTKGLKNEFETPRVNEPSGFEPLKIFGMSLQISVTPELHYHTESMEFWVQLFKTSLALRSR